MSLQLYQIVAANNLPVGANDMDATAGPTYLVNVLQDLKATMRLLSLNQPWISLLGLTGTWTGTLTWSFIDGTHASIQGDQSISGTGYLVVGQLVRAFVTGPPSTAIGTISAVNVASNVTTITVAWQTGAFDSGLSDVQTYGTLPPTQFLGTGGTYSSQNLLGAVVGTSTQFVVTANLINCWNPATTAILQLTAFSATCDITTAGPALNGRDQSAGFSSGSTVHFYAIAGAGQTPGLIASIAGAPPTGPTLPANYTSWAYLGTLIMGGTNLPPGNLAGDTWVYNAGQSVLSGGTAAVFTSESYALVVPVIAKLATLNLNATFTTAANSGYVIASFSLDGTATLIALSLSQPGNVGDIAANDVVLDVPNGQAIFYKIAVTGGATTASATINALGYRLPNSAN